MSTRYRRNPHVEVAPMDQETILYHPGANRFSVLNRTAAAVWDGLDGGATVTQLAAHVGQRFAGADAATVERDVAQLIATLRELDVIGDGASAEAGERATAPQGDPQPYAAPAVRVMSEEEILEAFQVTSAGATWWVM